MEILSSIKKKLLRRVFRLINSAHYEGVSVTKERMASCGDRVDISPHCFLFGISNLSVEDDVCIQAFTHIFCAGGVHIGKGTRISTNCAISSITHSIPRLDPNEHILKPVKIGKHVWIGMGATILPGISIGDYAVIGAGSVVTKSIPPCTVAVGNPAKQLRTFTRPDT